PTYSQSRSKPSKIPAPVPGPPYPPCAGRLPLRNMSMQLDTNFCRLAAVLATSLKYLESVQPPMDATTLRFGYFAFSSLIWLKLPTIGWLQVSATPETLVEASKDFW